MDVDISEEAVKAAPPVTVASSHLCGIDIPEAIQVLTLIYLCMQLVLTLPKLFKLIRSLYVERCCKRK